MDEVVFEPLDYPDPPRITMTNVVDLTPDEIARCRELSLGDEGYMCDYLDSILSTENTKRPYRYSKAMFVRSPDDFSEILGWGLLTPVKSSPRYYLHIFVDPLHRRKGYGSLLLRLANVGKNSRAYQPLVMTDYDNQGFFERNPGMYKEYA